MILITEGSALIVRCQTVVVTRKLLQLVAELVILPMWSTSHSQILALQILQTLLPDFIRVQIDDLISSLYEILPRELATGAVFAILNYLTLRMQLSIRQVATRHVAHIALVVFIALVHIHFYES